MKTSGKRRNNLGEDPISQLLVKFAVPSIIAMLVGALYNIVDQLFIGHYVGPLGNAATSIAFPLVTSCVALALLFGIGGASCFNLTMGRGERDIAGNYVGNAAIMLFFSGLVLCIVTLCLLTPLLKMFGAPGDVLPYAQTYVRITALGFPFLILTVGGGHLIRADGSPNMAMLCNLSGAIMNVVLDAWFVAGLKMGMAGAALATIIGQIFSGVIVIIYLGRYKTVKLTKEQFLIKGKYIERVVSIGAASFFNQIAMMVVQVVLNNSFNYYGSKSIYGAAIPLACVGIIVKVNQVFFSMVIGIAQGSQPIESFNYGAENYTRVRKTFKLAAMSGAVISIISFILFQTFPDEILALFGKGSSEYFEFGRKFFRIFFFCIWADFLQPITSTFFTSIGKPKKGIFLSLTRQLIFLLPLVLILPRFFGIDGLLFTGSVADGLAFIVTIFMAYLEFKDMRRLEKEKMQRKEA